MRMLLRMCAVAATAAWCMTGCDLATEGGTVSGGGLYVLNEGAFGQSNAELTFYSFQDGRVVQNVFSSANPGKTLGDVANHMVAHAGALYVVVNNSGTIEVMNIEDQRWLKTIKLDTSPRQMAIVGTERAYVTNMDSTVSVVDLAVGRVLKKITVGLFPEGIAVAGQKVFVAVGGFGTGTDVAVIDIASDEVVNRIRTGDGPTYLAQGPDGMLYVSCLGYADFQNPANDTHGRIDRIDPESETVLDSIVIQGHPGKLAVGPDGFVYVIGPGSYTGGPLWRIGFARTSSVQQDLVDGTFYAVGVDGQTGLIYLGDARGFSGNGLTLFYDSGGTKVTEFECGIGPTCFLSIH